MPVLLTGFTGLAHSAISCSAQQGNFYINEVNTKGKWVELYAKVPSDISGWSLVACSLDNKGDEVCETKSVSYSYAVDGDFKVFELSKDIHDKASDYLLKDATGALVDYFRVGMDLEDYPLQLATAQQCSLDNACNIYAPNSNGQRNFARNPDGGCSWDEDNWQTNTRDESNTGVAAGPNHIRVFLNNNQTALTCSPRLVDAIACADAACTNRYGSSVAVTLSPNGTAATIPVNGTGYPSVASTTAGVRSITLAASVPGTVGTPAFRCYAGTVAAPGSELTGACNITFADSGFVLTLPDHVSCTAQSMTVAAVKKDDASQQCVPGFANVTRTLSFSRSYVNPATGTRNPWLGGVEVGAAGASVAVGFDGNGVATVPFSYDDAGQLEVTASYAAANMTGSDTAIVAPAGFVLTPSLIAPDTAYVAGRPFALEVAALNACATPGVTPNFGLEAVPAVPVLSHTRVEPIGAAAVDGSFTTTLGAFAAGVAESSSAIWSEVGKLTLTATVSDYLGSSLDVTGTSDLFGPFRPAYFDVTVTPGCGAFTYSAQPFSVKVTANRQGGGKTLNYFGDYARDVTLSNTSSAAGSLNYTALSAARFSAGDGARNDLLSGAADPGDTDTSDDALAFTLTAKQTAPASIALRAVDTDGVSSEGYLEGGTQVRGGRLRLSNVYGYRSPLMMPVEAQYWSGVAWVRSSDDTCTAAKLAADKFSSDWSESSFAMSSGLGSLGLSTTTPGSTTVSIDLGDTGAGLPWLRSRWVAGGGWDSDPSAKATFGVFSPEGKKGIYNQEVF